MKPDPHWVHSLQGGFYIICLHLFPLAGQTPEETFEWKNENPKESPGRSWKELGNELNIRQGLVAHSQKDWKHPGRQTKSLQETGHSHITWITQSISNHMAPAICKELGEKTFIVGNDTLFAAAYSTLPHFCLLGKQHQCKDNKLAICLIFDSGQSLTWL